jgi:hypothetical protein
MKKIWLLVLVFGFLAIARQEAKAQSDTTFTASLSPSPFDDQLTIHIVQGNKNVTLIKIFDAIGKEVYSSDNSTVLAARGGVISLTLDFSGLKPGLYFCSIYSDKGIIETRKIFRSAR